jgi:hypothetical protein
VPNRAVDLNKDLGKDSASATICKYSIWQSHLAAMQCQVLALRIINLGSIEKLLQFLNTSVTFLYVEQKQIQVHTNGKRKS